MLTTLAITSGFTPKLFLIPLKAELQQLLCCKQIEEPFKT